MRLLFTLDEKDYGEDFPVIQKKAVRAVIKKDGLIATQRSAAGEYKLPGGGMEPGESEIQALAREVREETGLIIRPETVRGIGEILELREDIFEKGKKYEAHSYYYSVEVTGEEVPLSMTDSEIAAGYHLAWEKPEVIIAENERIMDTKWKLRDTRFLKFLEKERP